jgi:uncharacterized cupin superfamily protein
MTKTVFDDFVPDITGHIFRKCSPDWHIPLNTINDYNIIYIVKGNANYRINGAAHETKAGDLLS